MIIKEFEIVVNVDFGGFALDVEMAVWLMENKGWTVAENDDFETDKYDLVGFGDNFWATKKYDETAFRMNPDLVECVKELKKKYEKLDWIERRKVEAKVLSLGISTIQVHVGIVDVHDGKEEIECWTKEI